MTIPNMDELNVLHSNICNALGDPKRIQIMYLLHEAPHHVTAIAEALDVPQPTVSRHLAILKQRGLVTSERDGTSVIYHLANEQIIDVLDMMRQLLRDLLTRQTNMLESNSSE
ncbi:MAG: metalloregulator ArsR/SmtB family transcription factor [Anaerolineae bacterium]|nr:metalloregulator ArsR/SmtB family transcription factor [Anaerolineae bacterium]